jgi:anti-sigma B factor antagonist
MTAVQIKTETVNGASVIYLAGTLDGSSAPAAQAAIGPRIEPGCRLVIDLSAVDFMSSAGLRLMLSIFRQVSGTGGKVAMTGLSEEIQDTMSLTGFLDFFTTADTMDGALLAVQG